ncbi:MAG: hypothetical protein ACI8T1_005505 [Verrucomicrobiales bacterium]|jgi:hypothetical protein
MVNKKRAVVFRGANNRGDQVDWRCVSFVLCRGDSSDEFS